MRNWRLISLPALLVISGCQSVRIPNTTICQVAGYLSAGAICSETESPATSDLTFEEFVEMLEPQPDRPDPSHPGQTLPARGGAIVESEADYNQVKTALDKACRMLGNQCPKEVKQMIIHMQTPVAKWQRSQ